MKRLFSVLIVGILHGQEAQTPMLKRTPPPAVAVAKKDIVAVKKSFSPPAKQPDVRIDLVMPAPEPDKSVLEAIRLGMTVREEPAVPVVGSMEALSTPTAAASRSWFALRSVSALSNCSPARGSPAIR
jgi:hypothetical protein